MFAFGDEGSGLSSLAMALSMLGYRCCSDLQDLPEQERNQLFAGGTDRVFDAYVNIGSLKASAATLRERHPGARFIITTRGEGGASNGNSVDLAEGLTGGSDVAVLRADAADKWRVICEHLKCAPPACSFPEIPRPRPVAAPGRARRNKANRRRSERSEARPVALGGGATSRVARDPCRPRRLRDELRGARELR